MGGGQHTTPADPGLAKQPCHTVNWVGRDTCVGHTTHNLGHTMHHVDPTIDE